MTHSMSLMVFFAYYMYIEVSEWDLYQTWKDENIVEFWTFHYLLSNQMLKYNPTHRKYAGDSSMIPATYQNQSARYKIKYDPRGEIGRLLAYYLQFSTFLKRTKEAKYC